MKPCRIGAKQNVGQKMRNSLYLAHLIKCMYILYFLLLTWAVLVKFLYLSNNQIGDKGAEKLAEAIPHLKSLEVTWLGA